MNSKNQRRCFTSAVLTGIALAACMVHCTVSIAEESSTDWKLYAFSKIPSGTVVLFYSDGDIRRSSGGQFVKVWIKALNEKELEHARDTMSKPMMERAADKIGHYYLPPVATVESATVDQIYNMVLFEQLADEAALQPRLRILYDLDCTGRVSRTLSLYIDKNGNGQISSSDKTSEWAHVAPETPLATLMSILCVIPASGH